MSAYCCIELDLLLTLNHDARNHELKKREHNLTFFHHSCGNLKRDQIALQQSVASRGEHVLWRHCGWQNEGHMFGSGIRSPTTGRPRRRWGG